jgi:transcriptional regulator with XRE-family HTH domain
MERYQLRRAREQKGWSQSRVAEALGVTTRTVSRWEQGQALPYPYYRQQLSLLFEKNEQQLGFVSDATPGNACEEHDAQVA